MAASQSSHLAVHSLHQLTDTSQEYQLAVAANTEAGSSGLVWSSCTVINNRRAQYNVNSFIYSFIYPFIHSFMHFVNECKCS